MAAAGAEPRSNSPTPFLSKTYSLVEDHWTDWLISWSRDGSSFIVWDPTQFAKYLLPKVFKHHKFSSFVRQLNIYQFRKIASDRWEFSNENFRRGKRHLLCKISRRKSVTTAPAALPRCSSSSSSEEQGTNSSSSSVNNNWELIEENERLRNENDTIRRELSQIRSLFQTVLSQTSKYADPENSSPPATLPALDLSPSSQSIVAGRDEESIGTQLFGVCIGAERQIRRVSDSGGERADQVYGCPPELQIALYSAE